MKAKIKEETAIVRIFTDGSGQRPDGTGSGYAWLRKDTGEKKIVRKNGLTNNQAEYWAIISALENLTIRHARRNSQRFREYVLSASGRAPRT